MKNSFAFLTFFSSLSFLWPYPSLLIGSFSLPICVVVSAVPHFTFSSLNRETVKMLEKLDFNFMARVVGDSTFKTEKLFFQYTQFGSMHG